MELFNLVIFAIVFSTALVGFMVFGLLAIANILTSERFMRKYAENINGVNKSENGLKDEA